MSKGTDPSVGLVEGVESVWTTETRRGRGTVGGGPVEITPRRGWETGEGVGRSDPGLVYSTSVELAGCRVEGEV